MILIITQEHLTLPLQATHHIDSETEDVNAALKALGGARVILCTTGNAKAMNCVDGGCVLAYGR